MRTFWDQVVALVEQGDRPQGEREARLAGSESAMPQVGARSAALKAQCEDIGHALDHLERLTGLFQSFLSPVSELVLEFEACSGRLEETTARTRRPRGGPSRPRRPPRRRARRPRSTRRTGGGARRSAARPRRLPQRQRSAAAADRNGLAAKARRAQPRSNALAPNSPTSAGRSLKARRSCAPRRCAAPSSRRCWRRGLDQARKSGAGAPGGVEASVEGGERRAAT